MDDVVFVIKLYFASLASTIKYNEDITKWWKSILVYNIKKAIERITWFFLNKYCTKKQQYNIINHRLISAYFLWEFLSSFLTLVERECNLWNIVLKSWSWNSSSRIPSRIAIPIRLLSTGCWKIKVQWYENDFSNISPIGKKILVFLHI